MTIKLLQVLKQTSKVTTTLCRRYLTSTPAITQCQWYNDGSNSKLVKYNNEILLTHKIIKELELPNNNGYMEIYDRIPLLDISLPCISPNHSYEQPGIVNSTEVIGDNVTGNAVSCKNGLLKIRRKKMNKHKYKKRRKRDRAKIRKILNMRLRRKRKSKMNRRIRLEGTIRERLATNPKDNYGERPYVIHRLTKW